jgi:hypothetical protein
VGEGKWVFQVSDCDPAAGVVHALEVRRSTPGVPAHTAYAQALLKKRAAEAAAAFRHDPAWQKLHGVLMVQADTESTLAAVRAEAAALGSRAAAALAAGKPDGDAEEQLQKARDREGLLMQRLAMIGPVLEAARVQARAQWRLAEAVARREVAGYAEQRLREATEALVDKLEVVLSDYLAAWSLAAQVGWRSGPLADAPVPAAGHGVTPPDAPAEAPAVHAVSP